MSNSKNWYEAIDDLFDWLTRKPGRATEKQRIEPSELWNAPYEFQMYGIKKYLSTSNLYSFTFNHYFSHLIDFIPEEYLPKIAEAAIIAAETGAALERLTNTIPQISEQQVTALHPYLDRLFEVMIRNDRQFGYNVQGAWRGADNVYNLKMIIESREHSNETKAKACECLLETRNPEALRYVIAQIEAGQVDTASDLEDMLKWLGYEWDGSNLRQLYSDTVYHLIFQQDYRKHQYELDHPTHNLDISNAHRLAFGGVTANTCWVCHGPLHHVMTITQDLPGLPIHSRQGVELVTCLSCLYMAHTGLFYRHDGSGKAVSIAHGEPTPTPELYSLGFMPTEVALAPTPSRWQWQDIWHGKGNLSRLGGNPYWLQGNDEYLNCPDCGQRMVFLMQLMDNLPDANGNPLLWSHDTGLGYFFWCDRCAISGFVSVTL